MYVLFTIFAIFSKPSLGIVCTVVVGRLNENLLRRIKLDSRLRLVSND